MPVNNAVVRDTYRKLLEAIYRRWAPEKLNNVGALMTKYKGQEDDVYSKAVTMYVFSQDPEHWRPLIYGMYKRFNPAKLQTFDQVLEKYKNQEAQLFKALCTKYISALSAEDEPLEVYEWPQADDDKNSKASDSPQASACTPVRRGESSEASDNPPSPAESVQSSHGGSEASAGTNEPGTEAGADGHNAASASSRMPVLKATRPKAGARPLAVNGAMQLRESSIREEEARVFRGAAPKARGRAPETARAASSPEAKGPRCSLSANGSAKRRRVELLAARGRDSPEQDISPQLDASGHKSHSAGHRRRRRDGGMRLLPAPADGERSRSRSRGGLASHKASTQKCDRSRSREACPEPSAQFAPPRHSRQPGNLASEAAIGERRATRDRRRRRHQEAQAEVDVATRDPDTPPPLQRRPRRHRTGDESQRPNAAPLQAFVGAAPSNEGAGLPSELVEAEVEYRGEKVAFLISRSTTLQDVAEMYASWVRAHGGATSQ